MGKLRNYYIEFRLRVGVGKGMSLYTNFHPQEESSYCGVQSLGFKGLGFKG